MTNTSTGPSPRPVTIAAVIAIYLGFALLFILTRIACHPVPILPAYGSAAGIPADQAWQATAQGRRGYLLQLRGGQEKQLASYGWVDRKAGVVQLPIERAMELVAEENSHRK